MPCDCVKILRTMRRSWVDGIFTSKVWGGNWCSEHQKQRRPSEKYVQMSGLGEVTYMTLKVTALQSMINAMPCLGQQRFFSWEWVFCSVHLNLKWIKNYPVYTAPYCREVNLKQRRGVSLESSWWSGYYHDSTKTLFFPRRYIVDGVWSAAKLCQIAAPYVDNWNVVC